MRRTAPKEAVYPPGFPSGTEWTFFPPCSVTHGPSCVPGLGNGVQIRSPFCVASAAPVAPLTSFCCALVSSAHMARRDDLHNNSASTTDDMGTKVYHEKQVAALCGEEIFSHNSLPRVDKCIDVPSARPNSAPGAACLFVVSRRSRLEHAPAGLSCLAPCDSLRMN